MITNLFSRIRKSDKVIEERVLEYSSICGVVDLIEFGRTPTEIQGVLLDSDGREFEYKVKPNGDLIKLTGLKDGLMMSWKVYADYLKDAYSKDDVKILKDELVEKISQLHEAIEELREEVSEIDIPEPVQQIVTDIATIAPIEPLPQMLDDEELDIEVEVKNEFEDFSDEDLANHALKVLSGEVRLAN